MLRALDILDRPPAHCVLIGDSITDIELSRATGLRSIGYAKTPPAATNCTQNCQAQNRIRGRATVLGFPFRVPDEVRLNPRFP